AKVKPLPCIKVRSTLAHLPVRWLLYFLRKQFFWDCSLASLLNRASAPATCSPPDTQANQVNRLCNSFITLNGQNIHR
ncbi:hypothetical protein, partial [Klebsiella aerogenes]|uniref:hypothetical protein n=1 Tax=Klebsiella aerogenes TaxID=548 RepID=UPI0028A532DC